MVFKSTSTDLGITPAGFCPGVDCGPYMCIINEADSGIVVTIAKKENEASARNSSSVSPPT